MTVQALVIGLAALALFLVALSTGAALYYLLAALLAVALLLALSSAVIALLALKTEQLTRSVRATRGESVSLRIRVARRVPIPVASIRLTIASPGTEPEETTLSVDAPFFSAREYRCPIVCPHRGTYPVGVVRAEVSDAFLFFRVRRRLRLASTALTILPREIPCEPMSLEPSEGGAESRVRATEDTASPADVRAWQDGDTLKKVHWKLTMRRRELVVRTYEESLRSDTLILLDVTPVDPPRASALSVEDALCEAALAAARAQLALDQPVRMPLAAKKPLELAGQNAYDYPRFLETMAQITFDSVYPYEQFLAVEMRRSFRTAGAVLVTARLTPDVAETALRMRRARLSVSLIWVCAGARAEERERMERLRLQGVSARRIDPWEGRVA